MTRADLLFRLRQRVWEWLRGRIWEWLRERLRERLQERVWQEGEGVFFVTQNGFADGRIVVRFFCTTVCISFCNSKEAVFAVLWSVSALIIMEAFSFHWLGAV